MRYLYLIGFCFLFTFSALGQTTILMNGTLHVGNGQVIENGVLVMEQGKIVEVGPSLKSKYKTANVIDAKGKHIYPGLVCMNNIMGLNEIDAVRSTRDFNEQGEFNPNVRSLIAYNTDSKILPTALFNGILFTQAVPQGGLISGSSSLLKTKAWNWEDAAVKTDEGIHLNWPNTGPNHADQENEAEKQITALENFFVQANQYCMQKNPPFNARLEAMRGLLAGEKNLYIHTNDAKSILRSVNYFKKEFPSLKLILVGAQDAYLLIDFLKTQQIPVVVSNIHRLPSRNAEAIDQPYQTPAQLQSAGIQVAISYEGSWESRNLAYLAGTAAAYGMGKEEALRAITLTPATLMGAENRIGSLEIGKDASLLICHGDLLDMKSSALWKVFLEGEEVDLRNEQVALYEKYRKKYKME